MNCNGDIFVSKTTRFDDVPFGSNHLNSQGMCVCVCGGGGGGTLIFSYI